jgi:hypothetical protein
MYITAWVAIILEIVLLLIWVYSIFFQPNGTDPAGRGMAMVFVIGLCAYIGGGILLLLLQRTWSTVIVLVMACLPLAIVAIGLVKHYAGNSK